MRIFPIIEGGAKEKGTLIYDRSASLSSATSSEPALNRGDGRIAGTVPQSATDKSSVPFDDNNISQTNVISNKKPFTARYTCFQRRDCHEGLFISNGLLALRPKWPSTSKIHCCTDIVSVRKTEVNEKVH